MDIMNKSIRLNYLTNSSCSYKKPSLTIDELSPFLIEQYQQGILHRDVEQNYPLALEKFHLVSEAESPEAMFSMGLLLKNDLKDSRQAAIWFAKAAKQGNIEALFFLGIIYKDDLHDYPKAIEWFNKVTELGYAEGMYYLGLIYRDHLNDDTTSKHWFDKYSVAMLKNKHF